MGEAPGIKPEAQEAPTVLTRASVLTQSSHEGLVNCMGPDIFVLGKFYFHPSLPSQGQKKKKKDLPLICF